MPVCLALTAGLVAYGPAAAQPAPSAQDIVRRADEARFPQEGFEVLVNIKTLQSGRVREERVFKVLSKGNENSVVMTLEPASERGQILLMKARDLWMFLPRVSQPVRLSLAQRLVGQVSNGDIARANFAGDYNAKLLGTAMLGRETVYVLDLTAVDRSVTYQRVRYWVSQSSFRPQRAEFYSLSDRLLKTCEYTDYKTLGNKVRPTKLLMTDALNKGEQSTLDYTALKLRDLPDHIFSKEYLRRLE
ncbi:MAG TPA: outer membrane lipoprotein-sorting protein [Burkholderiales bacterium]|nr:outer membrane lipoprotein-sorting protein [Burkholderiales bacterium]